MLRTDSQSQNKAAADAPSGRFHAGLLQRKCACGNHTIGGDECAGCGKKQLPLQRARLNSEAETSNSGGVPAVVHDVLRSPGQPLDPETRLFFEPRFGHDFSRVRVHTDAKAAESALAVNARAYTVGANVTFAEGQYQPAMEAGRRLLAHELTHVVQQRHAPSAFQTAGLTVGAPADRAEREADQVADMLANRSIEPPSIAPLNSQAASPLMLQRQPAKTTTVRVDATGSSSVKQLTQGKGGSGGVVYDYVARGQTAPADRDAKKPGKPFDITLPMLIYPPAVLTPPKVDLFVFFHGMRADYGEPPSQGSEPIALRAHLQEAVAATNRLGIAPQAPATWRLRTKEVDDPANPGKKKNESWWEAATAQWHQALAKIGFDGLIKLALERLSRDLGLTDPLVPGTIHVAGHSAGGQGIIESTSRDAGAKNLGDLVQDVTLQDAGYGGSWKPLLDWFLESSPGKTVRVLISESEEKDTRAILRSWFNLKKINDIIADKKKTGVLKAEMVSVADKKARPGGFVLESKLEVKQVVKDGPDILQGTMVVFFAPGGGHYETAFASMEAAAAANPGTTVDFMGEAKPGWYRILSHSPGNPNEKIAVYKDSNLKDKVKNGELKPDTLVKVTVLQGRNTQIEDQNKQPLGWISLVHLTPTSAPNPASKSSDTDKTK